MQGPRHCHRSLRAPPRVTDLFPLAHLRVCARQRHILMAPRYLRPVLILGRGAKLEALLARGGRNQRSGVPTMPTGSGAGWDRMIPFGETEKS
jgi:hypothetical protein